MTGYGVKIVGDDVLPDGVEWMFVKRESGVLVLWIARSAAGSARALAEAWAASRRIERTSAAPLPRQRETGMLRIS